MQEPVALTSLCYLTPAKDLGLPLEEDVRIGVAPQCCCTIADVARGSRPAWEREMKMARARVARMWKRKKSAALYPDVFHNYNLEHGEACPGCGIDCAADVAAKYFDCEDWI